jgi:regulator of protease activity HflC (stomatin/prohibitin superfamily)
MTQLIAGQRRDPMASGAVKKKKTPTSDLPLSFGIIGAGFLFSHQAAAITRGGAYSRAAGPGFVFLNPGESVARLFDLRPQSRKEDVNATTRDGIPVKTSVSVTFQVRRLSPHQRRPRSVELDDIPYRYDPDALFELNYAFTMAGEEQRAWTEQVSSQAATLLVGEIGKYTLDELLVSGGAGPLKEIKQNIKLALESQQEPETHQTLPRGIEVVGVGVGGLEMPDQVALQRLTTWQVEWQNKVSQELVGGEIEVQRLIAQARARAQMENLENLLMSIESMRHQSQTELHDLVMRRLVETLEAMTASRSLAQPDSHPPILDRASEASSQMRQLLEQDEE